MKTYSYTSTKTRTEAVVDQFDMFLQYAGIAELQRERILSGVAERWLTEVAVYLVSATNERILQARVAIDWSIHSEIAIMTPEIRTDLPGWESGATPEVRSIGRRFGRKAQQLGITPRFWVRFTSKIHQDPSLHVRLCHEIGVTAGSVLPTWASTPRTRSYSLLDLSEVGISLEEAQPG